jgi:ABC-type polysaccharide/polyol phosphate export permease
MMTESPISVRPTGEIYDTQQRKPALVEEILAVYRYRELIRQFIVRNLKTRYKRSFLGIIWTMLNPLLTMAILTLVFSNIFRFSVENYPVYILCGLTAWNFFSASTQAAMGDMVWSGSLLSRIYVPKSVFAISAVGTGLVNLLVAMLPLLLIALLLGVKITPAILVMPLAILLLGMFALGIGLLLSAAAVYFADMIPVYEVVLMLWMYATPIIYPISIIPPQLTWIYQLNPMYYLITLFRMPLYEGIIPGWDFWLIGGGCAIIALLLGSLVFTAKSQDYAYRI